MENGAKEKLKNVADTRFKTVTIGSLDAVEKAFGFLWGHGLEIENLTEPQKRMRTKFTQLRSKILDSGHAQRRFFLNELDGYYDVDWKVNHYEFETRDDGLLVLKEDFEHAKG